MTGNLRLVVHGRPAPQGSKKPIILKNGRAGLIDEPTLGLTSWRQAVHDEAVAYLRNLCGCGDPQCTAMPPGYPIKTPVVASFTFFFKRPKSHYRTGANAHLLSAAAPAWPTTSVGDLSKLARSTEDALQAAGLLSDDGLIVRYDLLNKLWCDDRPDLLPVPGALIALSEAQPSRRRPAQQDLYSLLSVDAGERTAP